MFERLPGDKEITAAYLKGHIEDLAVLSSKSPRSHIPTPTNSTRSPRESGPHADMSGAVKSAPAAEAKPAPCESEKKTEVCTAGPLAVSPRCRVCHLRPLPSTRQRGETASGPAVHSLPPPLKTVADSCGSCWLLSLCVGVQLFFYILL